MQLCITSRHGNWIGSFTCRPGQVHGNLGVANLSLSLVVCAEFMFAITSFHLNTWSFCTCSHECAIEEGKKILSYNHRDYVGAILILYEEENRYPTKSETS
jgi:hypothetical protein